MVIVKTETLHFVFYIFFEIYLFYNYNLCLNQSAFFSYFITFCFAFYVDFDQFSLLQLLFAAQLNAPHCAAALALPAISR